EEMKIHVPRLRTLFEPTPGLHAGRHTGLANATGNIILYGDDDIVPAPTWVSAIAEEFGDSTVALAGGPCLPDWEVEPPEWVDELRIEVSDGWYIGEFSLIDFGSSAREIDPGLVFGCNFAIR